MALQNTANIVLVDKTSGLLTDTGVAYAASVSASAKSFKPIALDTTPAESDPGTLQFTVVGGALPGMNTVVVDVVDGVPTVTPTATLSIPDSDYYGTWDSTPSNSGQHLFKHGDVWHAIGGNIVGEQGAVLKSFPRVCSLLKRSADLSDDTPWETSTQYIDGLEQIDMWNATFVQFTDAQDNNIEKVLVIGAKTFTPGDWANGNFTKLYTLEPGENEGDNMILEHYMTVVDPESLVAVQQLMGGSAAVVNNKVYACTHGLYTADADSEDYSWAVLEIDLNLKSTAVTLGYKTNKFQPAKRFVMLGTTPIIGEADINGKIIFAGAQDLDATKLMNIEVFFNTSDSSYSVASSNVVSGTQVGIPLQLVEVSYDSPLDTFDDYYELTGTPGVDSLGVILGGIIYS